MTVTDSISAGISSRQFMKIKYTDDRGQLHTDILEGYTLGYDYSNQQILKGFRWASSPGPWYSTGRSTYDVERITAAELTGHKFGSPFDESSAKDSSEFRHIICDYYIQG
jgi:hypothetical protein